MKEITADLVLIIHFIIVVFISSLFLLIPMGYQFYWKWVKKLKLRLIHLGLMTLITFETIIGITCPLTIIENNLRGIYISNSFFSSLVSKIIFWELPRLFFLILYILCLFWTIFIWFRFPPEKKKELDNKFS